MKTLILFSASIFTVVCLILCFKLGEFTGRTQAIKELKEMPKIIEARAKGNCNDLVADMRIYHHN